MKDSYLDNKHIQPNPNNFDNTPVFAKYIIYTFRSACQQFLKNFFSFASLTEAFYTTISYLKLPII
uniref:Uncharacterized protein n=1 Tax=Strongyloides papillosus TaxID=174720 RepID=A0A0N5C3S5_STREA